MDAYPSADALIEILREGLSDRFGIGGEGLSEKTTLRDLGLDSLQILDIMLYAEDRLNTRLAEVPLPPNPTVRDVAAAIHANLAASRLRA